MFGSITTIPRASTCGRHRVDRTRNPTIRVKGEGDDRVAHVAGVQLCGSIHVCPVCSPRIRQERANDVDAAAKTWIECYGAGSVMLLTATMPHDYGEPLADLLATVRASFGAMISGRAWQEDKAKFGLFYYIVAHDVTVGPRGWHPHLHVLLFCRRELSDAEVSRLADQLHCRWSRAVTNRGHRAPSRANGIQLERARNRNDVARYVCQIVAGDADDAKAKPVALELARGDLKLSRHEGHRTPWQVLTDLTERRAREGIWTAADDRLDDRDLALWHEWERATKGLKAIRWARGLRAAVGLTAIEKTDAEIVAEEVGGVDVYEFRDDDSWRAVTSTPGGTARVLAAAEDGGPIAVRAVVESILEAWRARREWIEAAASARFPSLQAVPDG